MVAVAVVVVVVVVAELNDLLRQTGRGLYVAGGVVPVEQLGVLAHNHCACLFGTIVRACLVFEN